MAKTLSKRRQIVTKKQCRLLFAYGKQPALVLAVQQAVYLSKPNSLCNTRVANSIYFSSINTDTLISEVEII